MESWQLSNDEWEEPLRHSPRIRHRPLERPFSVENFDRVWAWLATLPTTARTFVPPIKTTPSIYQEALLVEGDQLKSDFYDLLQDAVEEAHSFVRYPPENPNFQWGRPYSCGSLMFTPIFIEGTRYTNITSCGWISFGSAVCL